jgi:hypothetical protein
MFRYSLKAFLLTTAAICILLAVFVKRAHDRRSAIAAIDAWGGGYTIRLLGPQWLKQSKWYSNNKWFYNISRVTIGPGAKDTDSGRPFDDAALKQLIPRLNTFSVFNTLDLRGTAVTDQGLTHLTDLNNIEELYLDDAEISDAGLKILARFKSLKRIMLNNTAVTKRGVDGLQAAFSNCEILWFDKR